MLVAPLVLAGGLAAATAIGIVLVESRQPPVGQFIEVDGLRLHYTDRGAGPVQKIH